MSTVFAAMPVLERSLRITTSQSVWIVSAYQLTFASTLLVSGRISDVYNPKFISLAEFLLWTNLAWRRFREQQDRPIV
ncbi:hypothetical protein BKA83DRAFT_2171880 [Pisolithus microcarpus]|nr:hypothetical protein BKA83DRAFT_2171880 [Pisolithus microcarpus]